MDWKQSPIEKLSYGSEKTIRYPNSDGLTLAAKVRRREQAGDARDIKDAVLVHGLNNDKDEDSSFVKLSKELSKKGFNVMRFDFRAHGDSEGKSENVTIVGELDDLSSSIRVFDGLLKTQGHYVIVASSFGAASSIIYVSESLGKIEKLVLWNPVLDFEKTFLKAETPWGRTFFNEEGYKNLERRGFIQIPKTDFKIGKPLVREFETIKPYRLLSTFSIPVLTIHGTKDTSVPFSVSEKYGRPNSRSLFISHPCDHQFIGMEDQVISETVSWILNSN